jgi:hypothetical protein
MNIMIIEKSELMILRFASFSASEPNNESETDMIEKMSAARIPALRTSVNGESVLLLKRGLIYERTNNNTKNTSTSLINDSRKESCCGNIKLNRKSSIETTIAFSKPFARVIFFRLLLIINKSLTVLKNEVISLNLGDLY